MQMSSLVSTLNLVVNIDGKMHCVISLVTSPFVSLFFFMCNTFPPAWHIVQVARVTDLLLDVWSQTAQREARHCCVPRTCALRASSVSHFQSDGKNVKLTSVYGPVHDSSEDLEFIRAVQGHPSKVASVLPGCTYIVLQEGYPKLLVPRRRRLRHAHDSNFRINSSTKQSSRRTNCHILHADVSFHCEKQTATHVFPLTS